MCWATVIVLSVPSHINFLVMWKAIRLFARLVADQVLRNPELYTESLISNVIQHFVLSLSKDRERADNHAIQAAADAFGVSVEIISSNSASFAQLKYYLKEFLKTL